ncbi:SH3 domain-containing protein [Chryseobacterium bernardetii]|uniref:SH3 domain-containing protein n=1 Tax=Chryseobacterium bernardetii TaxID=1241978 RepID=UPI000F4F547E|nr:SH3 domain-containing protein [Chryseobacterium bernardetii]AZB33996.1 hypothetical protein EG351_10450 [Chryseobacterium bernardetii]
MDKFDFKGITALSEKINIALSPISQIAKQFNVFHNSTRHLNTFGDNLRIQLPVNGIGGFGNLKIELSPGVQEIIRHLEILQNPYLKLFQDLNVKIFDNQLIERIQSINYWGELASATILNRMDSTSTDIANSLTADDLQLYAEVIESNLQAINRNPIEIFNRIVVSVKSYMEENPSVKVTANFIIWFITTVLIPVIVTIITSKMLENDDDKNRAVQIINNNYYVTPKSRADILTDIGLKNLPRNDSKDMFLLHKGDELEILKKNQKWSFVIKINTIETGWVRNEYLKTIEGNSEFLK